MNINVKGENYIFSICNAGTSTSPRPHEKNSSEERSEHSHPVYHIILYTQGRDTFLYKGRIQTSDVGTLMLTSPEEPHSFVCGNPNRRVTVKCFSFRLKNPKENYFLDIPFHEVLSLYSGDKLHPCKFPLSLNKRQFNELSELIDKAVERIVFMGASTLNFDTYFAVLEIFSFLIHEFFSNSQKRNIPVKPLQKAKRFIENNIEQKLTISEIAATELLSPSYFIRVFKKNYKITPINYLLELRIKAAKNLLTSTALKSGEIASKTGFKNIFYFSRTFKKHTGHYPSEYRKLFYNSTFEDTDTAYN
ncbi:MAG: hypothetical protein A2017_19175 [Lentisphaerae bacterium GWF2_44_16]|nr:MAG: hypothetical protein A2017_19175 [Lentisphaerae bacterium GWF2_44_16]